MDKFNALKIASKNLVTIGIDENVTKAHLLMRDKKIRHLIVQSEDKAIGIISDRDVMKALKLEIDDFHSFQVRRETLDPSLTVRDVMSWPIKSVTDETTLLEVLDIILKNKISSLMVTQQNAVVGIITTDDLLEILKRHINNEETTFWGEDVVNNVYSTPIRTVMEILSNTGI